MARNVLLLNVVGLTPRLLKHAPRLSALGAPAPLMPPLPAVTSTCEATILTGTAPSEHGIVANGWYFRELNEVFFWRPSNRLIRGPRLWDAVDGDAAVLFWRHNMATTARVSVAERPAYPADGRKIPDVYTNPPELGRELQDKFGRFPLFHFWGPMSGIESTRWITDATIEVMQRFGPRLTLVYLPHLDYDLQRFGPDDPRIPKQVRAVDHEAGRILDAAQDHKILVVSEYGIDPVTGAVEINRALRRAGLLEVIDNPVGELLDTYRSRAFAVCDHQIAHVYAKDGEAIERARRVLEQLDGVAEILENVIDKKAAGLDHARAGDLVALSARDRWFTYYYWLGDQKAPDFARCVDIHKKPGYDPVELFSNASKARIAWLLAKKKLGLRTLLDVIPLDASLVRGSHGLLPKTPEEGPILIGDGDRPRKMAEVYDAVLRALE